MNQTTTIPPAVLHQRRERVFLVLAGLFLGTLTMLNLLGISRFLVLASYGSESGLQWGISGELTFAVAVGVLPYPITFLCTDLISEFYGRRRANFLVLVGLLLNLWVVAILWIGGELPGFLPNDAGGGFPVRPEFNPDKGLYEETGWTFYQIRFLAISSVFASMVAYLAAQFIDVQVFHFWKRLTKGKHLWLRNNGSTIISQFVDTFAVITITHFYASALPIDDAKAIWPQLWLFIATGFAFKLIAALVDTPIIYLAVAVLRKYLHLDPTTEHNADAEEIQMFSRPEQG